MSHRSTKVGFLACAAHEPTSGAHKGEDLTQPSTWSGGLSIPLNVPTARYEVGRLLRLPHFFAAGAKFLPPATPAVSLQFSDISSNCPKLAPSKVLAWMLHIQSYLHRWGQSTQRTHENSRVLVVYNVSAMYSYIYMYRGGARISYNQISTPQHFRGSLFIG